MLSLILPPILVAACVVFLVWIFWKKRHILKKNSENGVALFRVRAPRERDMTEDATSADSGEDGRVGLGLIAGRMVQAFFSFAVSALLKPIQKARLQRGYRNRKSMDEVSGVAGVVEDDRESLVRARPMISDEITLPQKREEKNEYEQVLIERIALNPRDVEAYERLGDYYLEGNSLDDAKECFKQVLRLSPLSRRARFRMRRVEKMLSGRRR